MKYVAKKSIDACDKKLSHVYRDLNFNNDIFVKMYFIDESENDKTFNKVLLKNIDSVDSFFSGKVVK